LYASGEKLLGLAEEYKAANPDCTPEELEQFLLSCFVSSPQVIQQLVQESFK
jgi:hypothetical protein